jgi:hypothetical protein
MRLAYDRIAFDDAGQAQRRRRRAEAAARSARAARLAEAAARQATRSLLGPASADHSTWRARADGTAAGEVDGMAFRWARRPGHPELSLQRRCPACGGTWLVPVASAGQLIGALVVRHCNGAARPVEVLAG